MLKKIVKQIIKENPQTAEEFLEFKREFFNKYKLKQVSNTELLELYNKLAKKQLHPNSKMTDILKKRKIRTLSGVAPIAVLTKSFGCPGECAYCPTEARMPKSYLSNEPAVMRAVLCNFNPYKQVSVRIQSLLANGHEVDKIELIVMGGTWSSFSEKYKYWYITECFKAANNYGKKVKTDESDNFSKFKIADLKKALKKEQKKNEKATYKIVGLTLETRPDFINIKEVLEMRDLGCTRVELGVQAVDDKILTLNKRGHDVQSIVDATKLLKMAGFKICYHLMPNLPGATPKKDFEMLKEVFYNERFVPDHIKIYPCVVVKGAEIYEWWKAGKYKPYADKQLIDLLVKAKKIIPYYIRIIRLIRDIPTTSIEAGNKVSNLRQTLQSQLHSEGLSCRCIRCREPRDQKITMGEEKLFIEKYKALGGMEYFLSFETADRKTILAFLRLRVPENSTDSFYKNFPELAGASLIRELHTYGKLIPVIVGDKKKSDVVQHQGFGKRLMVEAEKITQENNLNKIAVIAGIGVREYYKKLGYRLDGTYMTKSLKSKK